MDDTLGDVTFSTDLDRVDRDWLWPELVAQYWAKYRTREMFDRQLESAWRIIGAYCEERMVGFCRAFSDDAAVAYLADVYVAPDARGKGIAQGMLRLMIDEGPGSGFRWMLHTADAHGLYRKFGFEAPDEKYLQREFRLPNVR